ncbi:anthranilate synthase component I family protein [Methanoplanus endosymbiosus]|uniref:anthranilate synthase n=1 Tax=Methanoplanus endosymbiosus TaxID=33865 RepID=A0A9E7TKF5_9EURY|nr:anthranilate synthase component I family protein [Methanoplanus endosymbiosus]UUX92580.1 anthranilate synthase component I family protein [Methanoplanus endosymbiosus]
MVTASITKNKDKHGKEIKKPQIIPVSLKLTGKKANCYSPEEIFRTFKDSAPFMLESACGEEKKAKYSLIGLNPVLRVKAENCNRMVISGDKKYTDALMPLFSGRIISKSSDSTEADEGRDNRCSIPDNFEIITVPEPEPVAGIHQIMDFFDYRGEEIPGYQGGLTGYFSYDLVYSLFETVSTDKTDLNSPLADFIMTSEYILFDHPAEDLYIFSLSLAAENTDAETATKEAGLRVQEIYNRIYSHADNEVIKPGDITDRKSSDKKRDPDKEIIPDVNYSENIPKEEFEDLVRKTKEYIFAGDIFQGVISKKNSCRYEGDPFSIYSALRRINPGPYMYYIDYGDRQVIGSSPEMLVKVEDNRVTTVPIAGTGIRGKNPKEDKILENELLSDEKERAEHLMLVDLARNDIGRISRYGSVSVDDFMKIEKFSHVQHIVSTVSGELKNGLNAADAFKSVFPAGTLTGAPKVRAMQIIDELESERRGLYGGAVGHIGFNGRTDFAIAIRTLLLEEGSLTFQAGAGIVADSDPKAEYMEAEKKALAVAKAITLADEVKSA